MKRLRASLVFLLWLSFASPTIAADSRMNVVLLLIDDMRADALGCMGNTIVQSPNIDRLAQRGVLFRNAFVTTAICAVSRASIFTGQWERRHGIRDFVTGLTATQWANTYPAQLRANGYHTGFIGKFGVGDAREVALKAGMFDFWRGLPGQAGASFFETDDPTHTHATARFGNQALEFLKEAPEEKPFCLSISFNAVHARDGKPREFEPDPRDESLYADLIIPLPALATDAAFQRLPDFVKTSEARLRWKGRFDTADKAQAILRDYYRLITGVDREVGRIVAALEARGLQQNTAIILAGDNGYALGDRGLADKWFMFEESLRVPLLIVDPRLAHSQQGREVSAMTLNVDLAPTILDLANMQIPETIQGRSLVPLLRGKVPADWRTEFFYEHHYLPKRIPPSEGVRTEQWKYLRWIAPNPVTEELYDLRTDPLEEHNGAGDPASAGRLNRLRAQWSHYQESLR